MEQHYIDETRTCRKCGEQHRVDAYRELKYYWCPTVNRILLVVNEEKQVVDEESGSSTGC